MNDVSFFWAFAAGFVSFLGPCVLPIIPGFLSFISGLSADEMAAADAQGRRRVLTASILFVLGFSILFVLMGASASLIGGLLLSYKTLLTKVAAVLIILFGLSLLGLYDLPIFSTSGLAGRAKRDRSPINVVLLGMAFAIGWTPCVGPILTAILTYAGSTGTVGVGMALLAVYSMGLGLPFILAGLLFGRFMTASGWIKRHYRAVSIVSGMLLVSMGILILTNQIVYVNSYLRGLQTSSNWSWTNL